MSIGTGIIKSANVDDIADIQNPKMLLALLEGSPDESTIDCLEDYDFQWHFKKAKTQGCLTIAWEDLVRIDALKPFVERTEMLKDLYCKSVGVPDSHIFTGFFQPVFKAGDHIWHRDAGESIAGLVIYNPQALEPSGHFKFAARNEEQYFKGRKEGLEFVCLNKEVGEEAPHGQLILAQHGAQDGVIHRAQHVIQGVRVRTMFAPK